MSGSGWNPTAMPAAETRMSSLLHYHPQAVRQITRPSDTQMRDGGKH